MIDLSLRLITCPILGKRNDLLDMELETAERRIEELNSQVKDLEVKVSQGQEEKEREVKLKANLEVLVKDLEASLEKENERAEEFKVKLSEVRSQLSSLEVTLSEVKGENIVLKSRVEEIAGENEKLACQLSEMTGKAANNAQSLTKRNEALQKMVTLLESDLDRKGQTLKDTEERLEKLEKEFDGYKVRAQSVLKKAKVSEPNEGQAKVSEVIALERVVQELNDKISELK